MSDIKLDLDTGDVDLTDGSLSLVTGAAAVQQELYIRFRFFKGDWFLNIEEGVPYYDLLGEKPTQITVEAIMRKIILTTPGVLSLDEFSAVLDNITRVLRVEFRAKTSDGDLIEFNQGFII